MLPPPSLQVHQKYQSGMLALTLFPTWIGVVLRVEPREVFNARSTFHEKDLCREQACKLKFKLRELISCFCCVVLEADSQGSSGT